jgi:hypothetical protein
MRRSLAYLFTAATVAAAGRVVTASRSNRGKAVAGSPPVEPSAGSPLNEPDAAPPVEPPTAPAVVLETPVETPRPAAPAAPTKPPRRRKPFVAMVVALVAAAAVAATVRATAPQARVVEVPDLGSSQEVLSPDGRSAAPAQRLVNLARWSAPKIPKNRLPRPSKQAAGSAVSAVIQTATTFSSQTAAPKVTPPPEQQEQPKPEPKPSGGGGGGGGGGTKPPPDNPPRGGDGEGEGD